MDYQILDDLDKRVTLQTRIKALELEHYGLVNGFSSVPHAVIQDDGESPDDALARFRKERLPQVVSELRELHAKLKELDG